MVYRQRLLPRQAVLNDSYYHYDSGVFFVTLSLPPLDLFHTTNKKDMVRPRKLAQPMLLVLLALGRLTASPARAA